MFSRVFEESDNKKYHLVKPGKSVAIKKSLKSWKIYQGYRFSKPVPVEDFERQCFDQQFISPRIKVNSPQNHQILADHR